MRVLKVVDQDINDKIDTEYIEEKLGSFQNIGIVYICTSEGGLEDEYVDSDGRQIYVIHIPYELAKKDFDVRPLMLSKAKERMGLALN
jgi:hypothetical protein